MLALVLHKSEAVVMRSPRRPWPMTRRPKPSRLAELHLCCIVVARDIVTSLPRPSDELSRQALLQSRIAAKKKVTGD